MNTLHILAALAPALACTALGFYVCLVPVLTKRLKRFMRSAEKLSALKDLFVNLSLAGPGFGVVVGLTEGSWTLWPFSLGWFCLFWWLTMITAEKLESLNTKTD